ncbi:hypothetical protein [Mucilaginibacter panaciglaebae]|uniref:Uncharacterized protein n=1 Tax=Mucilaginibacter panaciglaebae TaxID=502331 RepID=A0ABP7X577_9SPHI
MLKLDNEKINFLSGLVGYSFDGLISTNIDKDTINTSTYVSHYVKMIIQFKCKQAIRRIAIESDFIENDDGDMFYDYVIEQEDLLNYTKRPTFTFHSSPIKEILICGRKFEINDFKDYPDIYEKFIAFDKTDDVFIFKFENDEEALLYFDCFLHRLTLTLNRNEIELFWNNYGELYEKHWTIR